MGLEVYSLRLDQDRKKMRAQQRYRFQKSRQRPRTGSDQPRQRRRESYRSNLPGKRGKEILQLGPITSGTAVPDWFDLL
jgi:hypothetical protein